MIISYNEFCDLLARHIRTGEDFYLSLLENIINNPSRYCGLFRLSNAKTKIIQNVTQSREIKFGEVVEELTTEYISRLGYTNFEKNLGTDKNGDVLNVDQFFTDQTNIYIVEMKIRDDHDSTKKRGQYANFHKKIERIAASNRNKHIIAIMWFVDESLVKNKAYYKEEMSKENFSNCELHLYYGNAFFESLVNGHKAWNEFTDILKEYRRTNANEDVIIPDFGSSQEILSALTKLPSSLWMKLNSNIEQYQILREELFKNGDNLVKASKLRLIN